MRFKRAVRWIPCLALLFLLFVFPTPAQFSSIETEQLRLVYFDEEAFVIPHLIRCYENALGFHRKLFQYTPSEAITLLLHDFDDYGSGGTSTMPWNYISVCVEPFDYVYDTRPSNERMNWLMNHELVHVVATDKAAKTDRFFRSVFFGKVVPEAENPISMIYSYLTTPRWYSPRWYHEGIATFLETWMAGGIGRALGGYDEMAFRTMVRDSSYFYDFVGLESEGTTIDFQIGANSYLYGTRFVSYLATHYGPEKVIDWFSRTDDSRRYYASQFEQVYGTELDDEWSKWTQWEHEWQRANIDRIRQYPVTQARTLYRKVLGSVSRSFFEPRTRRLFVAVNYPGQVAHIAAIQIDTGTIEKVCDVPTPALYYVTSLAFDASSHTLFYSTNNSRSWRDVYSVNLATKETRQLLKDVRTGDLVFSPSDKALWGVQHHNGISRLVRMPFPYQTWDEVLSLPYGNDMFDIDISPDSSLLTGSIIEASGRQQLIKIDMEKLLKGESAFETLFEFEDNSPSNFVFSPDSRYLFGTSYYTGVSNIFRYSFEKKTMEALTNTETGYFRPLPISDDSLIAFQYTKEGFQPVMMAIRPTDGINAIQYLGQQIVDRYAIVKKWILPSPTIINVDSVTRGRGEYSESANFNLGSLYPVVEGFKEFTALGLRFNFYDRIGIQRLNLTASYSPNRLLAVSERLHVGLRYEYWSWSFSASYNKADFYDLFGPTKISRKGYSLGLKYHDFIIHDRPTQFEYDISLAGYAGLERLPDFQNVAASFDKFATASGGFSFSYLLRTLGALEHEKGFLLEFFLHNTYVRSTLFSRVFMNADYGVLLPLMHSSLWLRSSLGYSFERSEETFANFYFGGFGNNWADHQEARRYRKFYSFPGTKLNHIGAVTYGKFLAEWNLPPLHFRRFGFPSFYCTYAYASMFGTMLLTAPFDSERRRYVNLGAQADFKLVLFSLLESTLSFGYAIANELKQPQSSEFMISLKILK